MKSNSIKKISIGVAILVTVLVLASVGMGIFAVFYGMSPSDLEIRDDAIKITGMYGETVPYSEIKAIELIYTKPQISRRTNGYAFKSVRKGYFSNAEGEKFKLMVDSPQLPWICITKRNGKKIYYSSKDEENDRIYQSLIQNWPANTSILRLKAN